jgi:hypothetical protein
MPKQNKRLLSIEAQPTHMQYARFGGLVKILVIMFLPIILS